MNAILLTDKSPKVHQPEDVNIELKPHQLASIYGMLRMTKSYYIIPDGNNYKFIDSMQTDINSLKYINSIFGILSDNVGVGKTYIILGYISLKLSNFHINSYDIVSEYNKQETQQHNKLSSLLPKNNNFKELKQYSSITFQNPKIYQNTYNVSLIDTISTDKEEPNKIMPSSIDRDKFNILKLDKNVVKKNKYLIIVPFKLYGQWKDSLDNTMLNYYSINKRVHIHNLNNNIDDYDVILITNTMMQTYIENINNVFYENIIIDEYNSIIIKAEIPKSSFYWFISATPTTKIIRHYLNSNDIFLYFSYLSYTFNLSNFIIKNKQEFLDSSITLPPIKNYLYECITPKEYKIIKEYVNKDILDKLLANDINGAIELLGCNADTCNNLFDALTININKNINYYYNDIKCRLNTNKHYIKNIEITKQLMNDLEDIFAAYKYTKFDDIILNLIETKRVSLMHTISFDKNEEREEYLKILMKHYDDDHYNINTYVIDKDKEKELEKYFKSYSYKVNQTLLDNNIAILNKYKNYYCYNDIINKIQPLSQIVNSIKENEIIIKNNLTKLESERVKLDSLSERIMNFSKENCIICFDDLTYDNYPSIMPCCNQLLCMRCIAYIQPNSGKISCPYCREKVEVDKVKIIKETNDDTTNIETEDKKNEKTEYSKNDIVLNIITSNKEGRYLMFSEHDATFDKLYNEFDKLNIKYRHLTGNSTTINKILNDYKNNDIQVLLLNTMNSGAGLNLQSTTDIILYHRHNENQETQLIGRGQRLGRTESLRVHYVVFDKNTEQHISNYEEKSLYTYKEENVIIEKTE